MRQPVTGACMQIRKELLEAERAKQTAAHAAKQKAEFLARCKELGDHAELALEACTADKNRAAAALLERLTQLLQELPNAELADRLEDLEDDCEAQWEEIQVAAAIVIQSSARRMLTSKILHDLREGSKRRRKMEKAMAKVATKYQWV